MLQLSKAPSLSGVLGPGTRGVIWVQGCLRHCTGCIAPETWPLNGGSPYEGRALVEWFLGTGLAGLTISGGEPMLQAEALADLIRLIRAQKEVGVICYTGYRYEELVADKGCSYASLLGQIDLLIDGPYVQGRHADLLWRGSANQRLLRLTNRMPEELIEAECGVGVEFRLNAHGHLDFSGVPPLPHFRQNFAELMKMQGLSVEEGQE